MALIGDDCYFFYTTGCIRGSQCAFRHQPAAKNTETVCPDWLNRSCFNSSCRLRHLKNDDSRNEVQCYYDTQGTGCLKVNCPYYHTNKSKSQSLQSPIVSAVAAPVAAALVTTSPAPVEVKPLPLPDVIQKREVPVVLQPQKHVESHQVVNNALMSHSMSHAGVIPHAISSQNTITMLPSPHVLPMLSNNLHIRQPIAKTIVPQPQIIQRQIIAPQQQPVVCLPPQLQQQQPHVSILGPPPPGVPPANLFPKNEQFSEQVRQFKQMLASKGKDEEINGSVKSHKERQRKEKKSRKVKGYKSSKSHKKSKEVWSRADEEILYGDYKNVPLDKISKEERCDQHAESDPEVAVKSYEDVLREKALRKLMERRKEKFVDDFEELTKSKKTKKVKKSSDSDNGEYVSSQQMKRKTRKTLKTTDDIDIEFNNEDVVELNASPIQEDIEDNFSSNNEFNNNEKSDTEVKKDEVKIGTTENSDEVIADEAVVVIPDETTDINFSVDDADELALELSQVTEEENKPAASVNSKKMSSVVSIVKSKHSSSEHRRKQRQSPETSNQNSSSEHKRENIQSSERKIHSATTNKRKLVKIPDSVTKSKNVLAEVKTSPVKTIPIVLADQIVSKSNEIKVKSFDEIMAEKRQRKLGNKEILVISDDNENLTQKVPISNKKKISIDHLKNKTLQSKLELRNNTTETDSSVTPSIVPTQTADVNKPVKPIVNIKRSRINRLPNTDKEKQNKVSRRSIQLYKPPSKPEADTVPVVPEGKTIVNTGPRKIIRFRKSSLSTDLVDKTVSEKTQLIEPVSVQHSKTEVRSFAEIMREKRERKLRAQGEEVPSVVKTSNNLIKQRKRLIKQSVASTINPVKTVNTLAQNTQINSTKVDSNVARVPPLHAVPDTRKRSESIGEDALLNNSAPVTPVSGESDNVFKVDNTLTAAVGSRLSTSSPNIVVPVKVLDSKSSESEAPQNNLSPVLVAFNEEQHETETGQSIEDIQEALDEQRRKKEEDLLSDDEFEKEINEMCSGDDEDIDDMDDDDFMMELEEMIGST